MAINRDLVGRPYPPVTFRYGWRDCVLYALGVGATIEELDLLYEGRGPRVLPTFAVLAFFRGTRPPVGDLGVDYSQVVHGEQSLLLHQPLAPEGSWSVTATVDAVYDKGRAAVVMISARAVDAAGRPVFDGRSALFCRGEGGFGGDRGPRGVQEAPPEREPDFSVTHQTSREQALLYRLSGDLNPLHASPEHAQRVGFPQPILHGLCTYGFAARALIGAALDGDSSRLRSFSVRFAGPVIPGETLVTRGWKVAHGRYLVETVTGGGTVALTNAIAEVAA